MTSKSAPLGVRNVERPRPLRSFSHIGISSGTNMTNTNSQAENRRMSAQDVSSVEEVVQLLEQVASSLGTKNYDKSVLSLIIRLNASLKIHGNHMELFHRELLDRAQISLRNACKDTNLDIVSRLHLLEIIELRAMKWVLTDSVTNYYKQKLSQVDQDDPNSLVNNIRKPLNVNAPKFMPQSTADMGNSGKGLKQNSREMARSSGKYAGSSQQAHANIPNDETAKLSHGSPDRLVQITRSGPPNVAQAKMWKENTIHHQNHSPFPDGDQVSLKPESGGATNDDYTFSVKVGDEILKISSSSLQLVKSAKIFLEEHYTSNVKNVITVSRQPLFPDSSKEAIDKAEMQDGGGHSKQRREDFAKTALSVAQQVKKDQVKKISYDREFLIECSKSPSCEDFPPNWEQVVNENPDVVKKVRNQNMEFTENLKMWNASLGQWVSESTRC